MNGTGVVISEQSEEPGTIKPAAFGVHLMSSLPIRLFHIKDALNIKLYFDRSSEILGKIIKIFDDRGLGVNNSSTDDGVLNFTILNSSVKVCWM